MPRNAGENAVKQLDERSKKEWEKGGGDVEQADGSGKSTRLKSGATNKITCGKLSTSEINKKYKLRKCLEMLRS